MAESELKVSNRTRTRALAGSISKTFQSGNTPVLRAVGAQAVSQAVKGIALAVSFLEQRGQTLTCVPSFISVPNLRTLDDTQYDEITCMLFHLKAS